MSRLSPEPSAVRRDAPPPAALAADRLSYWFADRPALADVTLEVRPREVLAVLGPTGCGKTTLVRLLARMLDGAEGGRRTGTVRLAGRDIYAPGVDPAAVRRRVAVVLAGAVPFPATVFENVAFGPRVAGITADLPARVSRALDRAGLLPELADKLHAAAESLPVGQRYRLCLARALATDPEVLLLDEPAAGLDPRSVGLVEDTLFERARELAVVLATASPHQAGRVSDRIAFLADGKLVEVGAAAQMLTRPKQRQTEAYVTGRF